MSEANVQPQDMGFQEMYIAGKFTEIAEKFQNLVNRKYTKYKGKFCTKLEEEDVKQECMLEVAKAMNKYEPDRGVYLYTYVDKYVENRLIELAKHSGTNKQKHRASQSSLADTQPFEDEEDSEGGAVVVISEVDSSYMEWEWRHDLYHSIGLTGDEIKVIELKEHGFSQVEIAQQCSRTEGWVSQKLKSAKNKFNAR